MLRKSGILVLFLVLGTFTRLSAATASGSAEPAATPGSAAAPLLLSAEPGPASCAASPLLTIGDMGRRNLDSCITRGNTCDPRYVQNPVCCPGTTCQFVYPGVPLVCL
jgi:hypothetical protein